jgi:hypothetical protein
MDHRGPFGKAARVAAKKARALPASLLDLRCIRYMKNWLVGDDRLELPTLSV